MGNPKVPPGPALSFQILPVLIPFPQLSLPASGSASLQDLYIYSLMFQEISYGISLAPLQGLLCCQPEAVPKVQDLMTTLTSYRFL